MIRLFLAEAFKRLALATVCLVFLAAAELLIPLLAVLVVGVCLGSRFETWTPKRGIR
jgi:hypothetical protein